MLITNNIPINGSFTLAESGSETMKPNCQRLSVCVNISVQFHTSHLLFGLSVRLGLSNGVSTHFPIPIPIPIPAPIPITYRKATLGPIPMVILMERYNEILKKENYLYLYLESTVVVQGT